MNRLLFLFSIFLTIYANAQTSVYRPFPTNYGNWVYQYYDDLGIPTSSFTEYTLNGDTTIASVSYKKISMYSNYAGALRENNKIIYFVPDTSSNEYVLYDFNLNIGDTVINPFGGVYCENDTIIIQQVDSILASDGYHRQIHLGFYAVWIEGIGSIFYLLEPIKFPCLSGNDLLQCMASDSTFLYPSASSSCVLSVTEQPYKIPIKFTYFNSGIEIINMQANKYELSIYDILGRTCLQKTITLYEYLSIPFQPDRGMYILRLNTVDNTTQTTWKFYVP